MAARHKPKSRIRVLQAPDLRPGDPVWAYLRHSPGEDQTIHSQRRDVEQWAAAVGVRVANWYVDEARSGGTGVVESREAFEQLLADSQRRPPPVRAIVVWDLSRLSRDDLETQFYSADLRLRGYHLVSIHDDIPDGELGPVFEAFVRWKNRRFLLDLQAATLRGIDALVADRVTIDGVERTGFAAGGFPPRGYEARRGQTGTKPSGKPITRTYWIPTEDPDLRARVAGAWAMAIEAARIGERPPVLEMHKRHHIFADSCAYYDMLRTITYTGARKVGERLIENAHEPYISRAEFDLVQSVMPLGKRGPRLVHPKRVVSVFALSGRVFCGICGAPVNYDRDNRRAHYAGLRCSRRKNDRSACSLSNLNYDYFMDGLIEAIREQVLTQENLARILEEANSRQAATRQRSVEEKKALQRSVAQLDRQIERLLDLVESGEGGPAVVERLHQRQRERDEARARLTALTNSAGRKRRRSPATLWAVLDELLADLESDDPERQRRALQAVVVRATLTNEGGTIRYRLPVSGQNMPGYEWYPVGGTTHSQAPLTGEIAFIPRRWSVSHRDSTTGG